MSDFDTALEAVLDAMGFEPEPIRSSSTDPEKEANHG